MELMTVCTGNICRSPLAQLILATRLRDLGASVHSAGVRGLPAAVMTPEAIDLALESGVSEADADAHRSRYLTEAMLSAPDLILAMTRDHRRELAELAPARLRSTFTVREFARLAASLDDTTIASSAAAAGSDPSARLRAAAAAVAGQRGLAIPPADPADDDVIDPYRREWSVYQRSAQQLLPALDQVERVVRLAAA
ncbi:low molecular weight phosphatase family protein [Microbacterium telephonicum]|uniref:Protein-tyrosine phosphatase n=1 Tax=Microbacterium telephonicum TaxID=1714841 RepID=A0A498C0I8_9MICO|nr:low molecular weight phosphatase family protein [Microbacterium telephonicum]RLK47966.1 protein-tyrosine phosphatase [Microbacterium telephonicum]